MAQFEAIAKRMEDNLRQHYDTILLQQQRRIEHLESQIKHIDSGYGKIVSRLIENHIISFTIYIPNFTTGR